MTSVVSDSGYVDLQVNGYAGVDFNTEALTLEQFYFACRRMRDDGVAGALTTVITASPERMIGRLRNIVSLRERDPFIRDMIWGIHIEGPFITFKTGFVGAHPPDDVRPPDIVLMQRLLDAAGGLTRIVTLAPEHDTGFKLTSMLAGQGILVSAGHCDPTVDTLRGAIDSGLAMFTHLGNACPPMLAKHDNIIQRVLSLADRLWVTFIADGTHVPFVALGNYLRLMGPDRAIVITDAMSAAGMGPGRYRVGEVDAIVGDDGMPRLVRDPQYLAGSALTMPRAIANLQQHLGLSAEHAAKLCGVNPRTCLTLGRAPNNVPY